MPPKIWHIWPKVSRVESSKHRQSAHSGSAMSSDRSRMGIAWKTQGRPQKHGGKAEGGTRGHADLLTNSSQSAQLQTWWTKPSLHWNTVAITKHPHTSIRHLSVFTSEKLRLYKTLLLHEVMWPVPPAVSMAQGLFSSCLLLHNNISETCYIKLKMRS